MSEFPLNEPEETTPNISGNGLLDLGFRSHAEPACAFGLLPENTGDVIGRYRLLALLGEGGFGTVWKAAQNEPIRRELALKVIKPGLDSREISARFEMERQALALMDHPNIAGVIDAGTTDKGRPYFAMELVRGEALTDYCDLHRMGVRERVALFVQVCQAVQHAHQKSILHRDLKPSNILVATVDGKPVPKVIDFGISKALGGQGGEGTAGVLHTHMGVVIGTPRYMSPEQAGSRPDVDTRSDVYALGVVLCELLTGQSPHPSQPTNFAEALRWIRETDPVKPSTLAKAATPTTVKAAANRGMDPKRLVQRLRGDLDWITLKALEKNRALRYESAAALASDLQRHLAEEPVSAVAPNWRYNFSKFARRQRTALISACLIALALVSGTAVSLWQAARAQSNRQEAEHRYAQARDAVDKYLARVADDPKLKETNFVDLRRDLLQTALPFYEEMSQYQGNDPKLGVNRAWALGKLAWLDRSEGKLDQAEVAYRQSIGILRKLVEQSPKEPALRSQLGFQHTGLAMILQSQGKMDEALREHDQAVKAAEELVDHLPTNDFYQCALAAVLNDRAITLRKLKRDDEVLPTLRRAATLGNKFVKEHPKVPDYYTTLGTTESIFGDYLFQHRAYSEAAERWARASQILGYAIAYHSANNLECRYDQALFQSYQGMALEYAGNIKEAIPVLREAIGRLQSLVDEFPTYEKFRDGLIEAQRNLKATLAGQSEIPGTDVAGESPEMGHPPRKFTFDYKFQDPGPRHWLRDGANWSETQPSGAKNVFTIVGHSVVEGRHGTAVKRNGSSQVLFVPDVDSPKPLCLWMKQASGAWASLGEIVDVE